MILHTILTTLTVIFAAIAIISIILFILSGCDVPEVLIVTLIAIIIAVALGRGATKIKDNHTTISTEVVQMEVTKCDMTSDTLSSGAVQQSFYITVGNEHIVKVSAEEYAELNVGDKVMIEITTKTIFNEVQEPIYKLYGGNYEIF